MCHLSGTLTCLSLALGLGAMALITGIGAILSAIGRLLRRSAFPAPPPSGEEASGRSTEPAG